MSGNGVDIAAVCQLLREVANAVVRHDRRFDDQTVAKYHISQPRS